MAEEFAECQTALKTAQSLIQSSEDDVRLKFCNGKQYFILFSFLKSIS